METKTTKMQPTLYDVTVSDMGISSDYNEKLSNVIVIGLGIDKSLTFLDRLEEYTLNKTDKENIIEICEEIIDRLNVPSAISTCKIQKGNVDQGLVGAMTGGIKYNSPYEKTVEGMLSPDYKERFIAEYQQTKIRWEKLKDFCNRIEAAMRTCPGDTKRVQMPEHDCPIDILRDQQRAMGEYLHCLEIRAVIEGIDLT